MKSVQRSHEKVTIGDLENKTKFKVNGNTSQTLNVHQKGIGNMNTPGEQNTINTILLSVPKQKWHVSFVVFNKRKK